MPAQTSLSTVSQLAFPIPGSTTKDNLLNQFLRDVRGLADSCLRKDRK